jgi:GntR family transcriptional regulator, transcriptional repressor for pyruvate dehydrogenase complex
MAKFKPIRQGRVSDKVAEQLKHSIVVGHLKAGDKLPSEHELAERIQVSRVAIHEALRSLEGAGFIATRQGPGGGRYVTDLSFESSVNAFRDLYTAEKISTPEVHHARQLVEPEVARLAALHITPEYARRLRECLEAEEGPVESLIEDLGRKTAVHLVLAEMCGNRFLEALVRSLMGLIRVAVEMTVSEAGAPVYLHLHPAGMHLATIEAVIAGDAEGAASAWGEHAVEFGKNLSEAERVYREKKRTSLSSGKA